MGNKPQKVNSHFGKWVEPTEEEKIRMGLIPAPKPPGTIKVAIPKRYNNHSVMYESEWIDARTLERYEKIYPSVQIIRLREPVKQDGEEETKGRKGK